MSDLEESRADYEKQAATLKALAHPVRLKIVHGLLQTGCRNVGCMEHGLGISQSCVSQHLQKLRMAGIVEAQRSGNEVYYQVASPDTAALIAALFRERAENYVL